LNPEAVAAHGLSGGGAVIEMVNLQGNAYSIESA